MAGSANVDIRFAEVEEFMFRPGSRLKSKLLQGLGAVGMDRLAVQVFGLMMLQRYMILRAR